jgi:hypothetical protein
LIDVNNLIVKGGLKGLSFPVELLKIDERKKFRPDNTTLFDLTLWNTRVKSVLQEN